MNCTLSLTGDSCPICRNHVVLFSQLIDVDNHFNIYAPVTSMTNQRRLLCYTTYDFELDQETQETSVTLEIIHHYCVCLSCIYIDEAFRIWNDRSDSESVHVDKVILESTQTLIDKFKQGMEVEWKC